MPIFYLCLTSALSALLFNSITFYAELVLSETMNLHKDLTAYVGLRIFSVLPYLLLSVFAGSISDKYNKAKVLYFCQFFSLIGAIICGLGIIKDQSSLILLGSLFLGIHVALMSPSKYGLIPELTTTEKVSAANGKIEMSTFIAILLGVSLGGWLHTLHNTHLPIFVFLTISILGIVSSLLIKNHGSPATRAEVILKFNPLSILSSRTIVSSIPNLSLAIMLSAFTLSLGAFIQLNIPIFSRAVLQIGSLAISIIFASLGIGIGVGSLLSGLASKSKVELGLVPIGALISSFSLFFISAFSQTQLVILFMFLTGIGTGFIIVPVHSFIQTNSPSDKKGEILAFLNFWTFAGVIFASLVYLFLFKLHVTPRAIFCISGTLTTYIALKLLFKYPAICIRTFNWIITNCFYRLTITGQQNIPKSGGALIVANHMSFVDPLLVLASSVRPIRFLIYRPIYETPIIHTIARSMEAIPISPEDGPRSLLKSLEIAKNAIINGELVCIFAEGQISRIGRTLPFQKGFERIIAGLDVPVIPLYLHGIWGSVFSFSGGAFFRKLPHKIPYPVAINYGTAISSVSPAATSPNIREEILALSHKAISFQMNDGEDILSSIVTTAKKKPFKTIVSDSLGTNASYLKLFLAGFFIAKSISSTTSSKKVGILVPSSVGGVIANLAAFISAKNPVNINFTASKESIAYAIENCEIDLILTSKKAFEKFKDLLPEKPINYIYIDEQLANFSIRDKFAALFKFISLYFYPLPKKNKDELATVMFSSGSTGLPKGIMLSQGNIRSNLYAFCQVFDLKNDDVILGVLPFFHSFGFTVTLWLPLTAGVKAVFHPDPIDAKRIGELAQTHQATILLATPTFLGMYIKRVTKEQFSKLRIVVVGAEKMRAVLAEQFYDKYGVKPLEGYGCTELSPVATLNTPDLTDGPVKQKANQAGSVGHPLPGVEVKTIDPETGEKIFNKPGLLLVKGPNVMLGYLNDKDKTDEVIKDGWYTTGDIASVDENGFVTITDRLSRFSKIGGEMVPHGKIEEEIHKILGKDEQVVVITGVPDEKKGEKLVLISSIEIDISEISTSLLSKGFPALWVPKSDCCIQVKEFPMLGSGKLDLKGIREIACKKIEIKPTH